MIKSIKNILVKMLCLFTIVTIAWQLVIVTFDLPSYILPTPLATARVFVDYYPVILQQAIPTLNEALLGFLLGSFCGSFFAISLDFFSSLRAWFLPLLVISQALPTFVIAPLFVIWFGYGEASKIFTCMLMLFFPVTNAFYQGLRRTPSDYLALAKTMQSSAWQILRYIKIPAALPSLASGLRVAATFAPMGAIIGEWVGASRGLGFLMLNANANLQIDRLFAVLVVVILFALAFYYGVDVLLKRLFRHYLN